MHRTIGEAIGSPHYQPTSDKVDVRLPSSNTGIGVEIELENIGYFCHKTGYPLIFPTWQAVEDGSLRRGTEFIFNGPLAGIEISNALELFGLFVEHYNKHNNAIVVNERCSIHVHMDVRALTGKQLLNLIWVYLLVEKLLFLYVADNRIKNNYCKPLSHSTFRGVLELLSFNQEARHIVSNIRNYSDKYSAMNIQPVCTFGSVEFRHHPGTTDVNRIFEWIKVILSIKSISITHTIDQLLDIYSKEGYDYLIHLIFGDTLLPTSLLSGDKQRALAISTSHILGLRIPKETASILDTTNTKNTVNFLNEFIKVKQKKCAD